MSGFQGEIGRVFTIEDRATRVLERIFDTLMLIDEAANQTERALQRVGSMEFRSAIAGADSLYASLDKLGAVSFGDLTDRLDTMQSSVLDIGVAVEMLPDAFESAAAKMTAALDEVISRALTARDALGSIGMAGGGVNHFNLSSNATAIAGAAASASSESAALSISQAEAGALAAADAWVYSGRGGAGGSSGRAGGGGHRRGGIVSGAMDFLFQPETMVEGFLGYEGIKSSATSDLALQNSMLFYGIPGRGAPGGEDAYQGLQGLMAKSTSGTKYDQTQASQAFEIYTQVIASGLEGSPQERIEAASGLFPGLLRTAEVGEQNQLGSLDANMKALSTMPHMMGIYDPAKMQPIADTVLKGSEASHTDIAQMVGILKYSVPVAKAVGMDTGEAVLDTEFLVRQGLKGTTAGTGMSRILLGAMLAGSADEHGRMHDPSERRALYHDLHLTPEAAKEYEQHQGNAKNRAAHELGIVGADGKNVAFDSQGNFHFEKLIEVLNKSAETMDPQKFKTDLEKIFLDRGLRAIEMFLGKKNEQALKDYNTFMNGTPGGVAQQKFLSNLPMSEFAQAMARSNDLLKTLADSVLPQLGTAAKSAADSLDSITKWLSAHKDATKTITSVGGGALLGAGVGAVVAGPVGAVVGAGAGAAAGYMATHQVPQPLAPGSLDFPDFNTGKLGATPQSYHTSGGSQVHIENISVHGSNAEDMADQIVAAISRRLGDTNAHNLGPGAGIHHSPYTSGASVSI